MNRALLCGSFLLSFAIACHATCESRAQQANTPEAAEVIDDFIEALGSEMMLSSIESCRIGGRVAGPVSGDMEVRCKGQNFVSEMQYSASTTVTFGLTDGTWWTQNGDSSRTSIEGAMANAIQSVNLTNLYFRSWPEFDGTIEVVGPADFREQETWELRFTSKNDAEVNRFFDRESGLLVGCRYDLQGSNFEWSYEYSEVEDMLWISRAVAHQESVEFELTFTDFDLEAEIDDSIFALDTDDR
ncbi:MAG: hypothetical protein ACR2NP_12300 [Pirellulaceae bacterium]